MRPTSAVAKTLEDVIRWGSSQLFANSTDTQGQAPPAAAAAADAGALESKDPQAGADGQPEPAAAAAAALANGGDVVMQDAAAEPAAEEAAVAAPGHKGKSDQIIFSREQILQLLDRGAAACAAATNTTAAAASTPAGEVITSAAAGSGDLAAAATAAPAAVAPADLGPGLEAACVKLWPDVEKKVEDEIGTLLCNQGSAAGVCPACPFFNMMLCRQCLDGFARTMCSVSFFPCSLVVHAPCTF